MMKFLIIPILLFSILVFASDGPKVAIVKMKRGTVEVLLPDGTNKVINKGDWVTEGSIIKTAPKSFCKLSFIDKSSMNVGPSSEMKIEKFDKKEAGVINVISGKIRSKVTKDYLEMDKEKSKLYVKSKSSVMGVRGTDFMFSVNKKTDVTTTILFEGSIVFNKINLGDNLKDLEAIVNRGRRIKPGEFSVVNPRLNRPTVPAKMNSQQLKGLQKNLNLISSTQKEQKEIMKSVVPPGLSGEVVASDEKGLKDNLNAVVKVNPEISKNLDKEKIQESKGFVKGEDIRPPDGAIVHIDSGTIIPLGNDSKYDTNKNEWISASVGSIDQKGDYIPPKGFKITEEGVLLKIDQVSGRERIVNVEVKPLDQLPPLNSISTQDLDSRKRPDKDRVREVISNPFIKECVNSDCLTLPPVCDGCGIIPPTFQGGGSAPNDPIKSITNRPRTPVRIRVIKK